ncbi:MAG: hypothetical protein PHP57_09600 [Sideroxydans sp.]|nr:hypothetical protein [Sideroxydans sp.]
MKQLKRMLVSWSLVALALISLQANAATQPTTRDFNHSTTGFALSGGHAAAPCETCHVGGIFKGTPRACDACHATGKRIVATPKSNNHIATNSACETCHFNTATWLGARYNHGNATPGQCLTCHNGRLSISKPASHNAGSKATNSCDSCHRSTAWLPASWNHVGVLPGTCATCHNGSTATGKTGSHTGAKATLACDECHKQTSWLPAAYTHRNVTPGSCATCHNGSLSTGKTGTHTGLKGTLACDSCHRTSAWLPASFNHTTAVGTCASCHNGSLAVGKTGTHVAPKLKGTNACDDCHVNSAWLPAAFKHNTAAVCSSCHNGSIAVGKSTGHVATTLECNQCHVGTTTWLGALGAMPSNHIPFNAGVTCSNCHTGLAKVNVNVLHSFSVASSTCATCHIKPNAYTGNNQSTKSSHKGSSGNNCAQSGCHTKGAASYLNWDE